MRGGWEELIAAQLEEVHLAQQFRHRVVYDAPSATALRGPDGAALVSFASNDYLGLSRDPRVVQAAMAALDHHGTGAGSARLVAGTRPVHEALERALAAWKQTDAALVFPSGYAANLGVLGALGGAGVRILSDELNHASIIDGARLARGEVAIYRHLDLGHLAELLAEREPPVLVVSELVFSMDGDRAPLAALAQLCRRHGAALVLDEAHAVLEEPFPEGSLEGLELVRVGTLSKSLGSLGGFVAGRAETVALIENRARSYIFTTALSPADAAAAARAVQIVDSPEGEALRARLRGHIGALREGHPSPIVPIVLGSEENALTASAELARRGLYVPAIRPPTVPPGSSRLRISLSAAHGERDVAALRDALEDLGIGGINPRRPAPPPRRRPVLVAVVGTATDVGKTFVAEELIASLRSSGLRVGARKPLQSYAPDGSVTDARRLAAASGEEEGAVCPPEWSYELPLAPPIAASLLGRAAPGREEVARWLEGSLSGGAAPVHDVVVVELVGGLASPHTADGDGLDLLALIAPDEVLLVAHAGLGTLNDIGLATAALQWRLPGVRRRVLLNRFDEGDRTQAENLRWLREAGRLEVTAGDRAGRTELYEAIRSSLG